MTVFSETITFGKILELGEDSALIQVGTKQIDIELPTEVRETLFLNVEQGISIVPFDLTSNKIVLESTRAFVIEK